jgi:hypothetical protein
MKPTEAEILALANKLLAVLDLNEGTKGRAALKVAYALFVALDQSTVAILD